MKKSLTFFAARIAVVLAVCAPVVTFAAAQGVKALIVSAHNLINVLIGIVASCAFLFFLWGLAKFILHVNGDESAVEEGKAFMKWGIIALFVMMSIWGIVNFLISASGLQNLNPF